MRERNKRNITIGILCCLLVFMGVGFAVMNATLNINGTATAINTWDVRMTKIEVIEKSEGATNNEELTKINDDGVSATFQSDFTKPGDYITYEVTVENNGSIDAILKDISITLNVAEADKYLFNVTDTRPENELLAAGESTTFTIKVEFKSSADRMPSGDIEYTVKVDYSQQDEGISGGEETEEDWLYRIDSEGTIVAYNYNSQLVDDTTKAVVPATIDGIEVKKIDSNSFAKMNAVMFMNESDGTGGFVICDEQNYDTIVNKIEEWLDTMGSEASGLKNYYHEGDPNIPTNVELQNVYVDTTKTGTEILVEPKVQLKTLDLSQTIYLEQIGDYSFRSESSDEIKIEEVIFPQNGVLKVIGNGAFYQNALTNVTIPNSVEMIGDYAFGHDASGKPTIETLVFGDNSNLKSIGQWAFYDNQIRSLTIPSSVTEIGKEAFENQYDLEGNRVLTSITINMTQAAFSDDVTVGDNWYDDSLEPIITYLDN